MQHKGPLETVSRRAEARRGVMVFTQMEFNDTKREGKAALFAEKCAVNRPASLHLAVNSPL